MALVQRRSWARHAADDPGLAGLGRGSTPAEGRAESVPEAGGTGADAAATPTTPPPVTTQTHPRNRRPRPAVIAGRRKSIRRRAAWGTFGPRGSGRAPQPRTLPERGLSGGIEGGQGHPRQPRRVLRGVGWLVAINLRQASLGVPPTNLSGRRPEQRPPGRRGQAPRPRDRRPHAVLDKRQKRERSLTRRGV